jgi:hypothetical protein
MLNSIKIRPEIGRIVLFVLAFSSLFLGFYRNQWQMVRPKKFSAFQKDVESYVIARMVLTRQSGIFSMGGLLGWGDVNPDDINEADYQHQYDAYLDGLSFESYLAKESHPGFQGLFFSVLDQLSPFTPLNNLRLFRMLASGLFAGTLTGLILWFSEELGRLSAVFVLGSILVSQWMTLFGRNLFFVSGFFYLPMLVLLFQLQKEKNGRSLSYNQLFWLVFAFVLLKCLFNGYDFILPTLGMVACPIVFYGISRDWNHNILMKRFLTIIIAALSAILVSLMILSIQTMYASGSFREGIQYIIETINRRTFSNDLNLPEVYEESARASYWSILKVYLSESYFDRLPVSYFVIIISFAVFSVMYMSSIKNYDAPNRPLADALITTTWFSLLSPLSWYTIFKSVAYFHTHMNYLPWHMPFTLFGFGMCGYIIETAFAQLKDQRH